MNYRMLAVTALACGTIGGAALAQQEEAQILVDLVNVQADLAQELGVDQTQVPMTVMAPLSVAAVACVEEAATLEEQNLSGSSGSTDGTSDSASGGSDTGSGTGDGATTGSGSDTTASGGTSDQDGDDSARGCIAKESSPELAQVVQQEMSGATTSP